MLTKLKRILKSASSNCRLSATTKSSYYTINDNLIRISDHFSSKKYLLDIIVTSEFVIFNYLNRPYHTDYYNAVRYLRSLLTVIDLLINNEQHQTKLNNIISKNFDSINRITSLEKQLLEVTEQKINLNIELQKTITSNSKFKKELKKELTKTYHKLCNTCG